MYQIKKLRTSDYYIKNRERIREYLRQYYIKNREKILKRVHDYYLLYKPKCKLKYKELSRERKDKLNEYKRDYWARKNWHNKTKVPREEVDLLVDNIILKFD